VPEAPSGELTVTARLKPGEREIPGRTAPDGQIATIYLPTFAEELGTDRTYTGAYGLLRSESVDAETGELTPKPELTEGNHLSYAFQWIIFAVIAAVGLIYGLREEFKERNEDDPRVLAASARAEERRRNRGRKTDAEIEDELLDD
jgi:cytochrome oxidase assembly protein ShyY1